MGRTPRLFCDVGELTASSRHYRFFKRETPATEFPYVPCAHSTTSDRRQWALHRNGLRIRANTSAIRKDHHGAVLRRRCHDVICLRKSTLDCITIKTNSTPLELLVKNDSSLGCVPKLEKQTHLSELRRERCSEKAAASFL
jgi:hypothetical protein